MNNITNTSRVTRKAFLFMYFLFFSLNLNAQLPSGFVDIKAQGGYNFPMGVIFSKNGQKMFVWEKGGILWVSNWNGSSYIKQSSPLLNISDEVGNWRDFGLHSVALDPNFDSNGLIYLFYQVDRHHLLNFGTPQYSSTTDEYFKPTISRVTRYKINTSGTAENASRKVLLGESKTTGVPVIFESHGGGQIVFGTDGTLLVTTGDSGNFTGVDVGSSDGTYFQQAISDGIMRSTENVGSLRAQMINSFCGKLLRLDPNTGDGVSSNPYYDSGNPRSAKSRVWALGLRNPYRISFKTGSGNSNASAGDPGTIFVADVQNSSWEELHILEKGGLNCGWPIFEGLTSAAGYFDASANVRNQEESGSPSFQSLCSQANSANINGSASQRRFTHFPPALDWQHGKDVARYPDFGSGGLVATTLGSSGAKVGGPSFGGNAATSGTFYSGSSFPSAYQNAYFFADYGANWIKVAVLSNGSPQISEIKSFAPGSYGKGIVDIEYCPLDGSIFYVNINTGDIQKISYGSNTNRPPVAASSANKTSGTSPLAINFSSNGSSDPDGNAISYSWDFGDGSAKSTSANPSHTFTSNGSSGFTVTLTVTDSKGLTDSKSLVISINNSAPSVKITNPTNNAKYTLTGPTQYALKATITDNDPAGMQYAWQVTLRHNNHQHPEPILKQQSPTVQISPVGCDGDTYSYSISLTVTDKGGLTAKDEVIVVPDCNSQSLNVTNLTVTAKDAAVALTWTNTGAAFDEIMVVAKDGSGFISNPSGSAYTANASFTGNGSAFEGGKVVYKGKGTSTTTTSLTNGKKYFFRIFTRKGTTWSGGVEKSATPVGATKPPVSTSLFDPAKCYRITARNSGMVMDVTGMSTVDGAKIQQYSYNGGKNQVWRIKAIDATYYRIMSGNSGKAIDIKGASQADGANLVQYDYSSKINQQYKFESSGGYYSISARHSGKYLTVSGNSTALKAGIVQLPKSSATSQQWTVSSVTCPVGTVALIASQIYTVDGYQEGKKGIITWVSNATDADYFMVEKLDKNGDFETLDVVNAKPLNIFSLTNYYSYTDSKTFEGENTYRVTLVSDNTPPQYSNLINLNFKEVMDFTVFPNPTSDYVDIDLKPYEERPVLLNIVDALGREVRSLSVEKAGKTQRIELDGLPNGQYVLRIHTVGKRDVTRLFNITK
jgi:PKD repeat protein